MTEGWLSLSEAAQYCGWSPSTMKRRLYDAVLPAPGRKIGGRWRFHPDELEAWRRSFPPPGADLEAVVARVMHDWR